MSVLIGSLIESVTKPKGYESRLVTIQKSQHSSGFLQTVLRTISQKFSFRQDLISHNAENLPWCGLPDIEGATTLVEALKRHRQAHHESATSTPRVQATLGNVAEIRLTDFRCRCLCRNARHVDETAKRGLWSLTIHLEQETARSTAAKIVVGPSKVSHAVQWSDEVVLGEHGVRWTQAYVTLLATWSWISTVLRLAFPRLGLARSLVIGGRSHLWEVYSWTPTTIYLAMVSTVVS